MYTKRHYESIARALATARMCALQEGDLFAIGTLDSLTDSLADTFEQESSRFNRVRFLWAARDGMPRL